MTIQIKSEDYKYPTAKERVDAYNQLPFFEYFEYDYGNFLDDNSFADRKRIKDLFWWNECLKNRFGKLRETYALFVTNFNRGIQDKISTCTSDNILNNILFDYYAEISYYYFFSTRDIIAQLVRVYFNLEITEDKLFLNENFLSKIENSQVKGILIRFIKNTKNSSDYRNGFAHRFTPSMNDCRPTLYRDDDGVEILGFGESEGVAPDILVNDINNSMSELSMLMKELKKLMI
jgi:hypothetical protein